MAQAPTGATLTGYSLRRRETRVERVFGGTDLLKYAGLVAWLTTVVVLVLAPALVDEPYPPWALFGWWAGEILFGTIYLQIVWGWPQAPTRSRWLYLVLLTLAAIATSWFSGGGVGSMLAMVVASLLPWLTGPGVGITWMTLQTVALALAIARNPEVDMLAAVVLGAIFLGLGFFAFIASMVARQLASARDELRRVNSELRATQTLLAENTRVAERVRIARELHDLIGHHLTALTLNLEVATHLIAGKAREHVQQAHSIAKLLLSDVREVVGDMRSDDRVDLAAALQTLAEGVPEPAIHLDLPRALAVTDPQRAQVLLRCAQEIITNAVRHAQADNLWISLREADGQLWLEARDDGRGADRAEAGHGLSGMLERLRQLGGQLEFETRPGAGFRLQARLPQESQ